MAMLHFASGERKARLKLDQEREKELRKQLDAKEKRIDALHDKLAQCLASMEPKPKPKK